MGLTQNWFTSALIGMFCYAGMVLTFKRLVSSLDIHLVLLYVFALTTLMFLAYSLRAEAGLRIDPGLIAWLVLASGLAFFGTYFDLQALSLAPNVGYVTAVKGGQIIFVTIGAYLLFKDQSITATGAVGVVLIVAGIALLSLQSE